MNGNDKGLTPRQAIVTILRCHVVIIRNIARALNRAVTGKPWLCLCAVVLVSITTAATAILKARAERDSYNKALYEANQKIDSLKIIADGNSTDN